MRDSSYNHLHARLDVILLQKYEMLVENTADGVENFHIYQVLAQVLWENFRLM
jgi:hypothetical protein